jgi:DNA-directed RNA polymerase subunit RPC12/RpoP
MIMRGEPPPKAYDWRQSTLGDHAENDTYQRLWCEDCRHEITVHPRELMATNRVPATMPYWSFVQKLVCGQCGSKKTGMMCASWNRKRDNPEQLLP